MSSSMAVLLLIWHLGAAISVPMSRPKRRASITNLNKEDER